MNAPVYTTPWRSFLRFLAAVFAFVLAFLSRYVVRQDPQFLLARPSAVEWIALPAFVLAAALVVIVGRFYERWVFWRRPRDENLALSAVYTFLAVVVLIELFTAIGSIFTQSGWLSMEGFDYGAARGSGGSGFSGTSHWLLSGDPDIFQAMERLFTWQFLDAIPALDIPKTLNWAEPQHRLTDHWGGALLLVFKILVILPVIRFGVALWNRAQGKHEQHA